MFKLKLFSVNPVIFKNRKDFYKFVRTTMHQAKTELHQELTQRRPASIEYGVGYDIALHEIQKIMEEEQIREISSNE